MSKEYEMGELVLNYLKSVGLDIITSLEAISDDNLPKSYDLIKNNPNITKYEFVEKMGIEYDEEEIELEDFLRKLRMHSYQIAEALDEDNYDKTLHIYKTQPDIFREEFLKIMQFTNKYKDDFQ